MKILILLLIRSIFAGYPVAVFHGLGDACFMPGMKDFTKTLEEGAKNTAKCFESGASLLSIFGKSFKS